MGTSDMSPLPENELDRLVALRDLGLLDTPNEERYDRITRQVADLLDVPIAYLALIDADRQWLKSEVGGMQCEMARNLSFCTHTILANTPLIIRDASRDPRFADNPMVTQEPFIRFYAGIPIVSADGHNIGTFCVADTRPRDFSDRELHILARFAAMVQERMRRRPAVFISYAREDEEWKSRLVSQLSVLQQQDLLELWEDRRLEAGDLWQKEIQEAVESAEVAILLISASFLNSRFILDVEVPSILRRRDREALRVVPLVVRPCPWERVPWLARMNMRPLDGRPLSGESEHRVDALLAELGDEILELVGAGRSAPAEPPLTKPPVPDRSSTDRSGTDRPAAGRSPVPPGSVGSGAAASGPAPTGAPSESAEAGGGRLLRSLIVLPFADLSPEKDQEYFCDGMAEELVSELATVEGLRIVSRDAAVRPTGQGLDLKALGRELGVDAAIQGSVRKAGERLRISIHLVSVDGVHLWSETFDGRLAEVFEVQDEIASKVVEALKLEVDGTRPEPRPARRVKDLEAFTLYLRGRHFWNRRTEASLHESADYFRRAVEQFPAYARAHAGLGRVYATLGLYGVVEPGKAMPQARLAARKAKEIDAALAEIYPTLATVEALYEWSWSYAESVFLHAIELDPEEPVARQWYAVHCLVPLGRFAEARRELEHAIALDPLSPTVNVSLGNLHYLEGDYDAAVDQHTEVLRHEPDFAMARYFLGQALGQLGRLPEAIGQIESAIELSGGSPEMTAAIARARARAGQVEEARRLLAGLDRLARRRYVSPALGAKVLVALGEPGPALDRLEEARRVRAVDLAWLAVRPSLRELAGEPRFAALARGMGLPEPAPEDGLSGESADRASAPA